MRNGLCKYSIGQLCQAYGYSRQSYYKRQVIEERRERESREILSEVCLIRCRQPKVGCRKLQKMVNIRVRDKGIYIGRDRLFDFLRVHGLLIKRKKRYIRTTQSNHRFKIHKNLIKGLDIVRKGQVYVSDITYIDTLEGYCYLSLITDVYSRKIVGYALSKSLSIEGSMMAVKMAVRGVKHPEGLIHHSDRGIQYCSNAYVSYLKKHNIQISMTEENHVYENALAERVNGILKDEFMLGEKIVSYKIAERMVREAVKIYNEERLHMSLGYLTPEQKYAA